jgi:hypothetical protein
VDGSSVVTRLRPTRWSTRVTVDRGIRSTRLICHAVARVRRTATITASVVGLVRRGWRCGRDERSARLEVARRNHLATVRTLTPAAAAAAAWVQPSRRTR